MKYVLGNMLGAAGSLNPDKLSLDLQFAADKTLTARKGPTPVFTRASTATFVGSDGLIQSAAVNAPRFDHDPLTLACKGLLIEELRTNLATYSEAIVSGTGWFTGNVTVANSGTGPSGVTAQEITEATALGVHSIGNHGGSGAVNATPVVSGTTYTGSIFIKKSTVDWVQLTFGSTGFGSVQYANFNIANGTVGNSAGLASGTSPRIEAFPNGWYRCSMSATATATVNTLNIGVVFTDNTDTTTRVPSYLGNTANKFLASLAQFEAGAFPTSYIPTTTAALTRSADVCSITGSDFTGMWNQSEGTMFANALTPASGDRTVFSADDNTADEMIRLRTEGTNPFFKVTDGGSEVVSIDAGTVTANTQFKLIGAYKVDDFASSINGGSVVDDTDGTIPTVDRMRIGAGQGGNTMCGHITSLRYYKKRLTNFKLQSLTS
jgi:hypothetical protein